MVSRVEARLEARELTVRYGGRAALDRASVSVQPGEILFVMGPSGCGKTTLLKCLVGLIRPDEGDVLFDGRPIEPEGGPVVDSLRRQTGFVFQGSALLSSIDLGDNVALPIRARLLLPSRVVEEAVRMKLAQVGLLEAAHRTPSELSGGMRKRAGIARALALDPTLLLFDEPTSGLDPITSDEIDTLVGRLREDLGATVIVVSHDLASAAKIADRVVIDDVGPTAGERHLVLRPGVARRASPRVPRPARDRDPRRALGALGGDMNTTARDRRRALAFVVGSLLTLGAVLAILGGFRLALHDRTYYVSVPDSVAGLRPASTVEYKGVAVGVVRAIDFREGSVEAVLVELAIRKGVPIKTDTHARLRPQEITGLNVLELVGGTALSSDLQEGGVIPTDPSVLAEIESTVHDVSILARRLSATAAPIESEAAVAVAELRATLVAGRQAARTFDATVAALGSEVALSAAAFRARADDLGAILQDPAWRSLGPEALAALQDVRRAVARLDAVAHEAERLAQENRGDVRAAVENLRGASVEARGAARRVRESPASLFVEHPRVEKSIPDPLPPLDKEVP